MDIALTPIRVPDRPRARALPDDRDHLVRSEDPLTRTKSLVVATAAVGLATAVTVFAIDDDGTGGEAGKAAATAEAFYHHVADRDGESTCELMTPAGRADFEGLAAGLLPCEDLVVDLSITDRDREVMRGIRIRHVTVRGDRATISPRDVTMPGGADRLRLFPDDHPATLRRVGGRWLLEDVT